MGCNQRGMFSSCCCI
ncbi:MAG: hypothetical protein ACOX7D_01590 [Alphaproteobacteria bacterium]